MRDIQEQRICGNLTHDPELRYTRAGQSVVNLRVAVNHAPDSQGNQPPSDFFNVTVWGPRPGQNSDYDMAENCLDLATGDRVIVIGRYKAESYTTLGGETVHTFSIVADEVGASARFARVAAERNRKRTKAAPQSRTEGPLDLSAMDDDDEDF